MPISENAKAVLEWRYLARTSRDSPPRPWTACSAGVPTLVAEGDRRFDSKADVVGYAKEFYELMVSLDFLPNSHHERGPPPGQLSACFDTAGGRLHGGHLRRHQERCADPQERRRHRLSFSRLRPMAPPSTPPAAWPPAPSPL